MNTELYEIPENISPSRILGPAIVAAEALVRVDERLRSFRYGPAIAERFLIEEAVAWQLAEGDLVHREDLVAFDTGVFRAAPYAPLSRTLHTLRAWRSCLAGEPIQALRASGQGEQDVNLHAGRLAEWERVARQTEKLAPIVAAAVVWDAWCTLAPEENGSWKASLLSALTLRSRGLTRHYLLPLDIARRAKALSLPEGRDAPSRIECFLVWANEAATMCLREANRLAGVAEMLQIKTDKAKQHSNLGRMAELLIAHPVVTVPMAVARLGISKQTATRLMRELSSYVEELTDRQRYRAWRLR